MHLSKYLKLASPLFSLPQRSASSQATLYLFSPEASRMRKRWEGSLKEGTKNVESTEMFGQLSSLLEFFYSSPDIPHFDPIDFDTWREQIHTPKVVDNIEKKYNQFFQMNYDVAEAASKCANRSEQFQALEWSAIYNAAIWSIHYMQHLSLIENLKAMGDIMAINPGEWTTYVKGIEALRLGENEVGNYCLDDVHEHGLMIDMSTQFNSGQQVVLPFVHSADNMGGLVACSSHSVQSN